MSDEDIENEFEKDLAEEYDEFEDFEDETENSA